MLVIIIVVLFVIKVFGDNSLWLVLMLIVIIIGNFLVSNIGGIDVSL